MLLLVGGLGILFAIISSFFGWNRIKRALEKPENQSRHIPGRVPESIEAGEFQELPPHQSVASVTEGTTNLLDKEWTNSREKEKVPISRGRKRMI